MRKDGQIIEHLTNKEKIELGAGIPAVVITLYALWDRNYIRTLVFKNKDTIIAYAKKLMEEEKLSEEDAYGRAVNEFISYINGFRNLIEPDLGFIELNGVLLIKNFTREGDYRNPGEYSNPINYIWNKRYGNLSQELIDKEGTVVGTLDEPLLNAVEDTLT